MLVLPQVVCKAPGAVCRFEIRAAEDLVIRGFMVYRRGLYFFCSGISFPASGRIFCLIEWGYDVR